MRNPSFPRYTSTAIALHWLIAALIIIGFSLGWIVSHMHGFSPEKLRYISWHKWIGVTVFALALVRVVWRLTHRPPPLPASVPSWQRVISHLVHGLLYVLMIAIPLSGYLYSSAAGYPVVYLNMISLPTLIHPDPNLKHVLKQVHVILNYSLLAVFSLHILGALKHTIIDRDGVWKRMLPFHQ
jgi:cytochrome b561